MKSIYTKSEGINAFALKIIAIIAMLINHIGHNFNIYANHYAFYLFSMFIGKLTFPIMAYLLVEGYKHTKDVKLYAFRLAVAWCVSIVPFWLAFNANRSFSVYDIVNNVMFTLLMGLLLLIVSEKNKVRSLQVVIVILFSFMTLLSDWSIFGVLLIYFFYKIKGKKKIIIPILSLFAIVAMSLVLVEMPLSNKIEELVSFSGILLTIPLLYQYNGKRGYSPSWVKWGFYIFYPLHLLIIGLQNTFFF